MNATFIKGSGLRAQGFSGSSIRTPDPGPLIPLRHSGGPANAQFRDLRFDDAVHIVLAELVSHPDGILDGIGVGTPMANNGDSFQAKQRGAAVFGIVQAPLELAECLLGKDVSDLCRESLLQFLAEHRRKCFNEAFARSEEHTSELQSLTNLVCRLLLEKKKK